MPICTVLYSKTVHTTESLASKKPVGKGDLEALSFCIPTVIQARTAACSLLEATEEGSSASPGSCSLAQLELSLGSDQCGGISWTLRLKDHESY